MERRTKPGAISELGVIQNDDRATTGTRDDVAANGGVDGATVFLAEAQGDL